MKYTKKISFIALLLINLASVGVANTAPISAKVSNAGSMRILFVVGYFPVLPETFILNQITRLIDRGHQVYIYAFHRGNFAKVHRDVRKYRLLKRTFFNKVPRNIPAFDIIYCQFGFQGKRIFQMQKKQRNLRGKVVTCFRGSDISVYLRRHPHAYDSLLKKGDLFLPVCEYFKKRLIKLGCKPDKIIVHHSAIDCGKFTPPKSIRSIDGTIQILSVGRLVGKKGMKYTIKAIARLIKKYPNIHLTIVGDGPQKQSLKQLIKKLGLEKYVTLYGWAIHKEVVRMLRNAHIFVLASNTASDGNQEGIPNVLKEAMAMELPVVSTHHAGIPELIEYGVSGMLVPQRDDVLLAKKIEYLIRHPETWHKFGVAGRKKVKKEFDIDKVVSKLEQIFYTLLG